MLSELKKVEHPALLFLCSPSKCRLFALIFVQTVRMLYEKKKKGSSLFFHRPNVQDKQPIGKVLPVLHRGLLLLLQINTSSRRNKSAAVSAPRPIPTKQTPTESYVC